MYSGPPRICDFFSEPQSHKTDLIPGLRHRDRFLQKLQSYQTTCYQLLFIAQGPLALNGSYTAN